MRISRAFASALISAPVASIVPSPAQAHPPVALVMDARGNVFYSDLSRVWMISPDGRKSIAVPGVHTHELYLDASGNLFGEHLWYEGERTNRWGHRVWRRAPDGAITNVIPATTGFLSNFSFVRDREGTMYWAERGDRTEIRKRGNDGKVRVHSRGPFHDVRWMIARDDGVLFLVDAGDLKRIALDGSTSVLAPRLAARSITRFNVGEHHSVMGLWLDAASNVYAAIYGSGEVKRVTPAGVVSVVARSRLPWSPTGGMFGRDGDLWILEASITNAVRVKRIRRDRTVRIY